MKIITFIKHAFYRLFQWFLFIFSFFYSFQEPRVYRGLNHPQRVLEILRYHQKKKVLIVTDQGIMKLGLLQPLIDLLKAKQLEFSIYDQTSVNPTVDNIEQAYQQYLDHHCDVVLGFGGGSALDCAKGVLVKRTHPKKTLASLRGILKVGKKKGLMIAIPTTAGTGSEATVAVVVSNPLTHEKYAISDPGLMPDYAILDPSLTMSLPPFLTAVTGMDALTHAIEAYLNLFQTSKTKQYAKEAILTIHQTLLKVFKKGDDLKLREAMLQASYQAGVAFTRVYVGYVHCIAHTLGGFYQVNHGLANALVLPHVLKAYGKSVHLKLAELADVIGITQSTQNQTQKAEAFILYLEQLNGKLDLQHSLRTVIQNKDVNAMVARALCEGNPWYPVPKILEKDDLAKLYQAI